MKFVTDTTNAKKRQRSKEETAKLAVDEEETVINLFMAWEGTIDLADS